MSGYCHDLFLPSRHAGAVAEHLSGWQIFPEQSSLEFQFPHLHQLPETHAHQNPLLSTHTLHIPCLWLYFKHRKIKQYNTSENIQHEIHSNKYLKTGTFVTWGFKIQLTCYL